MVPSRVVLDLFMIDSQIFLGIHGVLLPPHTCVHTGTMIPHDTLTFVSRSIRFVLDSIRFDP